MEEEFLAKKFQQYYSAHFVKEPSFIERREFGFGVFGKKISERHFAFKNAQDFNSFLKGEAPFYASCSPAHYEFPDAQPMQAKHFLGSDLLWEFDADDFKTPCSEKHTLWKCLKCGLAGTGKAQACTACGEKTVIDEWVCPECLEAVKKQSLELLSVLRNEFGFAEGISLNFSGSKGFHIHLRSEEIFSLPQSGRVELLNYLTGHELDLNLLGFLNGKQKLSSVQFEKAKGWQEKILKKAMLELQSSDSLKLHSIADISEKNAGLLLNDREKVLESLRKGRLFELGNEKKTQSFWKGFLEYCAESVKLKIDRQTSIDLVKIVRVPETLHGSTGLLARKVPESQFKEFDALKEAIVFSSNPVKVIAARTPRFYVGGEWFEQMENQTVELPEFAAVFLLARNAAKL